METYTEHLKRTETTTRTCDECDGRGFAIWSCCGDDITNNVEGYNNDLCPSCYEHCGDEKETCQECNGEGEIEDTRMKIDFLNI